jgi:hypothetical protein
MQLLRMLPLQLLLRLLQLRGLHREEEDAADAREWRGQSHRC